MSIAAVTTPTGRATSMGNEDRTKELLILDEELNSKTVLAYVRSMAESATGPAKMIIFVGLQEKSFPPKNIDELVKFVAERDYGLERLVFEYQGGLVYRCDVAAGTIEEETTVSFYLNEETVRKTEKLAEQLQKVNMNRFIVLSKIVKEPLNYVLISRSMLNTLGKAGGK
jgi:hypothetical protein